MEYYVDIADIEAVKAVNDCFPIDGFTTNPNLLARAARPPEALLPEYRDYARQTRQTVFVQVTAQRAEEMVRQAQRLWDYFGDRVVVKLPAVIEGYRACKLCKARGIRVCVTVVHSAMQALMAARAGADYVAPYISHIDNLGADGVGCVAGIVKVLDRAGSACKVLGASFRTVEQIAELAAVGCHAVTITPEMFRMLIAHPATDASMRGFEEAWRAAFGSREITDFLPEAPR